MTTIIRNAAESTAADLPVMKLADFARQAREVILDARKEAARIVAEARQKAEALKQEAARQGHEEGLAQGLRQGRENAEQAAAGEARARLDEDRGRTLERADAILTALESSASEACGPAADEVLRFAMELARKIVGRLAVTDISVARTNLAKAMRLSGSGSEVIVAVNPRQLEQLREEFADFVEAMNLSGRSRLIGDSRVGMGGVKITSARGRIDATVEAQLDKVASALAAGGVACPPRIAPGEKNARKFNVAEHLRIVDTSVSV